MATAAKGKFVVYKSSAGSGKTFTLVREYLKIVLQNPDAYRQVLAITFTNKAANEMKERVVKSLVCLVDPDNHRGSDTIRYMLPKLIAELAFSETQIRTRAAEVLRRIIHHYSEFAISTIDSFTHRIIRTFAHDLKIPLNFEVELDTDAVLSEAVDLLVGQVGSNEQLTRILVDFVENKAGDEMNWQIEKELNEFGKNLLNEDSIDAVVKTRKTELDVYMKIRSQLVAWKTKWENTIGDLSRQILNLFESEGLTDDDFIQKGRGIYGYFRNLSLGNFEKVSPNSYATEALNTGKWISAKAPPTKQDAFDRIGGNVFAPAKRIVELTRLELPQYYLAKILLGNLFSTALLGEIGKAVDELCKESNKLLISEFNRRISNVVREQPAPFIYERLGERYHHYLIDEFQDTSIMQWHNLLPLIENSLASYRMNLVVGDAKQAIYRWRSGDAEQFELLPRLFGAADDSLLKSREQALERQYQEERLDLNHRSSPVIVNFNNRFFTFLAGILPQPFGEIFRYAEQTAAKTDKPGYVRIEKVEKGENEGYTYDDAVHEKILTVIYDLQGKYNLNDIAILCRKNEKASAIAAFLIQKSVPVVSSESLLLSQSVHVNFLVAWIRLLADPADEIQRVHIVQYLISRKMIHDLQLEELAGPGMPFSLQDFYILLTRFFPFIDPDKLNSFELFNLVQYLIFHFGLYLHNDSYLRFFQDKILEFVQDKKGGLNEFPEWWDEEREKASVVIPEGVDAVRIMTIHKAKGLHFPVVIFPFADETLRSTRKNIWVDLDEEFIKPLTIACLPVKKALQETPYSQVYDDEMNRSEVDMANVLYVAMTRPEERLYVMVKDFPEKAEGTPSVPKYFSRFFQEEKSWEKDRKMYDYGSVESVGGTVQQAGETPGSEPVVCRPSLKMLLRRHAPAVWDMEDPARNREWGNLVHYAMSNIENADRVEKVIGEMEIAGMISSDQKQKLAGLIDQVLQMPMISRFFEPGYKVRNEPEIITTKGLLYRPDRVVLREGHANVIDYKTGKPHPGHREQVMTYATLLKEMQYHVDEVFLLYLDPGPELVRVI